MPETNATYPHPEQLIYIPSGIEAESEIIGLREELAKVNGKLIELEKRVPQEDIIILRDISKEQARSEIRNLFQSGRTLYYSDIADELCLDLELVVNVCNELLESKEIHIDDRAS